MDVISDSSFSEKQRLVMPSDASEIKLDFETCSPNYPYVLEAVLNTVDDFVADRKSNTPVHIELPDGTLRDYKGLGLFLLHLKDFGLTEEEKDTIYAQNDLVTQHIKGKMQSHLAVVATGIVRPAPTIPGSGNWAADYAAGERRRGDDE